MTAVPTTVDMTVIPIDVIEFVQFHKVREVLSNIMTVTRERFPNSPISLSVRNDPETCSEFIAIEAIIPEGISGSEMLQMDRGWGRDILDVCGTAENVLRFSCAIRRPAS